MHVVSELPAPPTAGPAVKGQVSDEIPPWFFPLSRFPRRLYATILL